MSDSLKVESHGRAFLIQLSAGTVAWLAGSRPSGTPIILRRFSAGLIQVLALFFP
jgi:hypothetical protein